MGRPRAPRTIRGRVTLVTAIVLTVVLGIIAALVIDQVRRHGLRTLDQAQALEAEALATMVRLYDDGLDLDTDGQDILRRYADPAGGVYYQITARGRAPLRSPSLAGEALPEPPSDRVGPVPAAFPAQLRHENLTGVHDRRLRLLTSRLAVPRVVRGEEEARPGAPLEAVVVQLARSPAEVDSMRAAVTRGLVVALPIGLLLGSLGAFLLARRVMAPLGRLCEQARAIGAGPTDARLDVSSIEGELREMAETFNEAIRRLGEVAAREHRFAVDASHELRTPLAVLRARLELTLSRERTPAEYRAALSTALTAGMRLEEVVQSLLLLARAEGGGVHREPLDLVAVVGRAVDALRPALAESGVEVAMVLPDRPLQVVGSGALLDRMVSDVVENAGVHGAAGREVEVRLTTAGDAGVIDVLDRGPGFPTEFLPRVFERFARGDASRARATGGAGLGLAIARSIARLHGGDIAVQGRPGGGAQVRITLPIAHAEPTAREAAASVMRSG